MALDSADKKIILNPVVLASVLKDMDQDVATRFIASAFSLNNGKIKEAYNLALHEMFLREKRKKELAFEKRLTEDDLKQANEKLKASTEELFDDIQELLRTQSIQELEQELEQEVEIEVELEPDEEPDKEDDDK